MVLKMVNDKSVIGMPYKRVIDMLMKTKRPIQLVFVSVTFDDGTRRTESIDEENPFLQERGPGTTVKLFFLKTARKFFKYFFKKLERI